MPYEIVTRNDSVYKCYQMTCEIVTRVLWLTINVLSKTEGSKLIKVPYYVALFHFFF